MPVGYGYSGGNGGVADELAQYLRASRGGRDGMGPASRGRAYGGIDPEMARKLAAAGVTASETAGAVRGGRPTGASRQANRNPRDQMARLPEGTRDRLGGFFEQVQQNPALIDEMIAAYRARMPQR